MNTYAIFGIISIIFACEGFSSTSIPVPDPDVFLQNDRASNVVSKRKVDSRNEEYIVTYDDGTSFPWAPKKQRKPRRSSSKYDDHRSSDMKGKIIDFDEENITDNQYREFCINNPHLN